MDCVSNSSDLRSKFKTSGGQSMKDPTLNWCCGLAFVLGLPLGLLVALSEGSLLAGFASATAVVVIGLLITRKEIAQEYKQSRRASARK